MNITTRTTTRLGVLLGAALLALSGCAATESPVTPAAQKSSTAGDVMTISDAWVKAADSGMSAAFGTLTNTGSTDVTVTSASTEASSMVQLHETVADSSGAMVMREIDGGFVIPAGGTLTLKPGGSHIMMMNLTNPLKAGDEVSFILAFSDDSTFAFTAPVKDYSGANENYQSGETDMNMGNN